MYRLTDIIYIAEVKLVWLNVQDAEEANPLVRFGIEASSTFFRCSTSNGRFADFL